MGLIVGLINLYLYNHNFFNLLNNLHINLNIISVFFYIISFSSFLNTFDRRNKKSIVSFFAITILSLDLLYISKDMLLFITTLIIYILLATIKIFNSDIIKYKRIVVAIILSTILIMTLTVTFAQPHLLLRMLNPDAELVYMQNRLNQSKLIGDSEIPEGINTDYYYMNFSNYSFIYLVENYGKILGIFIISLLALLSIKIIFSYKAVKDKYGKFLIIGLGSFIFIQSLLNLLTLLGVINLGGNHIPFITHNNASIILYILSVGLILSIYSRKNMNAIDSVTE